MFNLFKKEEVANGVETPQSKDWTKDLKRNQLAKQDAEQMSLLYYSDSDYMNNGTKLGLSSDHLKIIKNCKNQAKCM